MFYHFHQLQMTSNHNEYHELQITSNYRKFMTFFKLPDALSFPGSMFQHPPQACNIDSWVVAIVPKLATEGT